MLDRVCSCVLVSLLVFTFYVSASAQRTFKGEVVDIVDGKTVVMLVPSGKINVELQFIDVPGDGQIMNNIVREHLRGLVMGKTVEYRPRNILRDRTIGKLMLNNVDVSQQMLRDGAAWHVPARLSGQDDADFQSYASTEAVAKDEKRGVWSVTDLKPSWQRAAEAAENRAATNNEARYASKPQGVWSDKNPRLGNTGSLLTGYNAATKTGFLSTLLAGIGGTSQTVGNEVNLFVGATYFYKEYPKGRNGVFRLMVSSNSRKMQFLANNDLWMIGGGKKVNLGKPQRNVDKGFDFVREDLTYSVTKSSLERMINNDDVMLKVGPHFIQLIGSRYLFYNLLQFAE